MFLLWIVKDQDDGFVNKGYILQKNYLYKPRGYQNEWICETRYGFLYFDLQGDIFVAHLYLKLLENGFVSETKKCLVKKLQSNEPATSRSFLFFDFNVGNPERAHHTLSGSWSEHSWIRLNLVRSWVTPHENNKKEKTRNWSNVIKSDVTWKWKILIIANSWSRMKMKFRKFYHLFICLFFWQLCKHRSTSSKSTINVFLNNLNY